MQNFVATNQTILDFGGGIGGMTAGLDGHVIQPKKLQDIAVKVVPAKK